MKTMRRVLVPAVMAAGWLVWCGGAAGQGPALGAALEKTVAAEAAGSVGTSGDAAEPVSFSGQAMISGRIVRDTTFGAPPGMEITVDLSNVRGKGLRTGKAYVVSSQTILHRPLVAFETVEVSFPFTPDGQVTLSRSAMASFGIYYTAAKGMTTTPVRITTPSLP
jgi:hypothetical protein